GLPDLELIARLEDGVADRPAIDVDAVGTVAIDEPVASAVEAEAEFGVPAGDFGGVQSDRVSGVAADTERRPGQLELPALVGAFDHEQTRHDGPLTADGRLPPYNLNRRRVKEFRGRVALSSLS